MALAALLTEIAACRADIEAIEAAEAGVSLNRLVSYKLAMPTSITGQPGKRTAASKRVA